MSYQITEIEGIGPSYGEKLNAAGIKTTEDLLARCSDPQGRDSVAQATGLSAKFLLDFANMADLMRISGVGGQYAELLKAAGVDTVKEFRTRKADNLAAKMQEVNAAKNLTKGDITAAMITKWLEQAKDLKPRITY